MIVKGVLDIEQLAIPTRGFVAGATRSPREQRRLRPEPGLHSWLPGVFPGKRRPGR